MHGTKFRQKVTSKHTVLPVCRLIRRQNDAFHTPHSQHPSPKSTRFFRSRPGSLPNTLFSRIFAIA